MQAVERKGLRNVECKKKEELVRNKCYLYDVG